MIWKIVIAVVILVLLTTGFFGLDYVLAGKKFHDVSLPMDKRIPLKPAWIWIYLLYYPFCFLPLLFPGVLQDNRIFYQVISGLLFQFAMAWAIFYFLPTRIPHPDVHGDFPSARALKGLYAVDIGYNIFPSLHVANVIYVSCVATRFLPAGWSASLFLISALISASTLYIKQHYFLDVPAGLALGVLSYWLAFL